MLINLNMANEYLTNNISKIGQKRPNVPISLV